MHELFDVRIKSEKFIDKRTYALVFKHLVGWCIFMGYELSMLFAITGSVNVVNYFFHYLLNTVLFYAHSLVVFPAVFERKGIMWLRCVVLVILEFTSYIVFSYCCDIVFDKLGILEGPGKFQLSLNYCAQVFYRSVYIIMLSSIYYFVGRSFKQQKLAAKLERERLDTLLETQKMENAFLKAQINPHFLFNTLSFVYNEVRNAAPQAGEAVLSLSQIMRYAIESENNTGESYLLQEIEEVENLIKLHKIRLKNNLNLELNYGANLNGVKIIPLVLITLVENVFKHGNLSLNSPKASINVFYMGGELIIETHNQKNNTKKPSHNIGIANIKKRLNNHYRQNYSFDTELDEMQMFHVSLIINLPEK